jgi:hypothetical protein
MSAVIVAFAQPAVGTNVSIVGFDGERLMLRAPGPDGRAATVHGRPPPEATEAEIRRAARQGRLSFTGPWWNLVVHVAPPPPRPEGQF